MRLGIKTLLWRVGGPDAGAQAAEEEEGGDSRGTKESGDRKGLGPDERDLDPEAELMRTGLPLQFGGMSAHKNFEMSEY